MECVRALVRGAAGPDEEDDDLLAQELTGALLIARAAKAIAAPVQVDAPPDDDDPEDDPEDEDDPEEDQDHDDG